MTDAFDNLAVQEDEFSGLASPPDDFADVAQPELQPFNQEVTNQIIAGASEGLAQGVNVLTEAPARALENLIPLGSLKFTNEFPFVERTSEFTPLNLPGEQIAQPQTVAGGVIRGGSQFAVGFIPSLKAASLIVGKGGPLAAFAKSEAAALAADQLVFDPFETRLSDYLTQFENPILNNRVTEFLSSDPEDSEAEARLKLGLEGAGLGALFGIVFGGLKAFRRLKGGDAEGAIEAIDQLEREALKSKPIADPEKFLNQELFPPDFAGNINLNNIIDEEGIQSALKGTADEFEGRLESARRGRISIEQTSQLADELGMDVETLLERNKGQAFNAEEALAARRLLVESAADLSTKARSAVGGDVNEQLAFQEALQRHVAIQEQVAGLTAEAGRALRVFREKVGRTEDLRQLIDQFGGSGNIDTLADMISKIDTPEGLARFSREALKPTTQDKLFEVWYNSLLSGPTTQAVNVLSNALVAAWTVPEHFLAAAFGAVRKGPDKITGREAAARAAAIPAGIKDGLKAASKTFLTEESQFGLLKNEVPRQRSIGGTKGRLIRVPGRLLGAGDEFFKAIGYRMELHRQATKSALDQGLRGREAAEHIQNIIDNPPKDIQFAAIDAAEYQTFTNNLGKKGQDVLRVQRDWPGLRIIVPFVRTPANIAKFAIERTPAAPLLKEARDNLKGVNGKAARDLQLARITMGSGVGALVMQMAAEGRITGGGPKDPALRSQLFNTGWKPYSIRFGDRYIAYNRVEPLGILLGLSADASDIWGEMGSEDRDKIATLITTSIAKNVTSKTWLEGISNFIEAMDDPERFGDRFVQRTTGTLIPTGVAQVARIRDPILRDVNSTLDALKSRIPGFSDDLPARRNLWGETIILSGAFGPDIISPLYSSFKTNDFVSEEMVRLKFAPRLPKEEINGIQLTREQYWDYVERAGKPAKEQLEILMSIPAWDRLPDSEKESRIRDVIQSNRDNARKEMIFELSRSNPDFLLKKDERELLEILSGN